jgi:8-oxo-dGTP pyrophosphatase MutT (NUDIX family)
MSEKPVQEIPFDRLPPGFAEQVDRPVAAPAETRPAATVVVLRDGVGTLEVLLLRRTRSAGFVPGAYVFPGGRVDRADGAPALLRRLTRTGAEGWARRLELPLDSDPPAAAFLLAALRETFEETGILLARTPGGAYAPSAASDPETARLRSALNEGSLTFPGVLEALEVLLEDAAAEYIAHWVTPEVEPRRYDTRFFAVRVPPEVPVEVDRSEIVDHRWLTPEEALAQNRSGALPMVFPTIRTLEELRPFSSADEALAHYRSRRIPMIMPRLVRTPTGVGIQVPE